MEMEDLVSMAMKVEKQQCQRVARASFNSNSKWSYKGAKFEDKKKAMGMESKEKGVETSKKKNAPNSSSFTPTSKCEDIKCFRCHGLGHCVSECPNKRMMVLRGNKLVSKSEDDDMDGCDDMPSLEDCSGHDKEVQYAIHRESLVARQVLNLYVRESSLEQCENIFHTRCLVRGKMLT